MTDQGRRDGLVRVVLAVLAVLLLFPLLLMVFAMPMMGVMGWWDGGGPAVGLSPLWGILLMLSFLIAILGVGYLLYRGLGRRPTGDDRAVEELRMAYARGDLSDEEFERRRQRLQRDRE